MDRDKSMDRGPEDRCGLIPSLPGFLTRAVDSNPPGYHSGHSRVSPPEHGPDSVLVGEAPAICRSLLSVIRRVRVKNGTDPHLRGAPGGVDKAPPQQASPRQHSLGQGTSRKLCWQSATVKLWKTPLSWTGLTSSKERSSGLFVKWLTTPSLQTVQGGGNLGHKNGIGHHLAG